MKNMKKYIVAILIVAAFFGTIVVLAQRNTQKEKTLIGSAASDFTLPIVGDKGKKIKLSSQRGYVVLVDFWATWCPPCKQEIPYLIQMQKDYKGKKFKIIGVALDENEKDVIDFRNKQKIKYTLLWDPNGNVTARPYNLSAIPCTYIIDKKGIIRGEFIGFSGKGDIDKMKKLIDKYLEQ